MNKKIEKWEICCGECNKMFSNEYTSFINKIEDVDIYNKLINQTLFFAQCSHCGYKAPFPAVFLYHDPEINEISLVLPYDFNNRYLYAKWLLEDRIKEYKKITNNNIHNLIDNSEKGIIQYDLFLSKIKAKGTGGNVRGLIHFSPFPSVNLIGGASSSVKSNAEIKTTSEFYYSVADTNLPKGLKSIFDLLWQELHSGRVYLPERKTNNQKKGIGTFGLIEVVLFATTSIVIPILVSTVSNLLSTTVTEKKRKRKELEEYLENLKKENYNGIELEEKRIQKLLKAQENGFTPSDRVEIKIIDESNNKEYVFKGSFSEVNQKLKKFKKECLLSVQINGNCHVAPFFGNETIDFFADNKPNEVKDIQTVYSKYFTDDSRVRFIREDEEEEKLYESFRATQVAMKLIELERYEDAIEVLAPNLNGENTTIDVLYNLAVSLEKLGYEDSACDFYERVIVRSINLPTLKQSSSLINGLQNESSIKEFLDKNLENKDLNNNQSALKKHLDRILELKKKYKIE